MSGFMPLSFAKRPCVCGLHPAQPALSASRSMCLRSVPPFCSQTTVSRRCAQIRAGQESVEQSAQQPRPDDCENARGAIAVGRDVFAAGDYEDAIEYFEKSLDLPGTGTKRFRDKPPIASPGEKQAALYNLACCYSRLDDIQTGLTALAGCFESGYTDVDQARSDPDLENLRKDPRFEGLVKRLVPMASSGLVGKFLNSLQGR